MKNLSRTAIAAGMCAALTACMAPPRSPSYAPQFTQPTVEVNTAAPRCSEPRQCELFWLRAQEQLGMLTGMRLRLVTADRLETFAPTSLGRMGGTVLKYPVDGGAYELRLQLDCYRGGTSCDELRNPGINLFNTMVPPVGGAPRP